MWWPCHWSLECWHSWGAAAGLGAGKGQGHPQVPITAPLPPGTPRELLTDHSAATAPLGWMPWAGVSCVLQWGKAEAKGREAQGKDTPVTL